ncbi:unnamed protein product [Macrosiphum euphorbiae]|uniref:Uncharacterized protein n=1 Tax=Macrosiphum euphorbiae TaxID=13131 RepID=A0AAV0WL19_9HEMI|nr:unnamed protein product [Macrosiphum euphorbiae]
MLAKEFYTIIQNEESATNFLISKKLLVNVENVLRDKCSSEMKYYIKKERGKERKLLRCKRKVCQTTQSIRKNNRFWTYLYKNGRNYSGLSIGAQLELVYYWCQDLKQSAIITLTGRSAHTVCDWMNLCRDVPVRIFENRNKLGGPGIVIQVDECL